MKYNELDYYERFKMKHFFNINLKNDILHVLGCGWSDNIFSYFDSV